MDIAELLLYFILMEEELDDSSFRGTSKYLNCPSTVAILSRK